MNKQIKGINLDVDVRNGVVTATDLRVNYKALAQKARTTGRPILITAEGTPSGILISPELLERIKDLLNGEGGESADTQ